VLHRYLKEIRFINASNALYKRDFLNAYGIRFPKRCRYAEDREFIIKSLYHAQNAAFTPEPLVAYVQHPGQTTNKAGTGVKNMPTPWAFTSGSRNTSKTGKKGKVF
jgi:hypothetical protein